MSLEKQRFIGESTEQKVQQWRSRVPVPGAGPRHATPTVQLFGYTAHRGVVASKIKYLQLHSIRSTSGTISRAKIPAQRIPARVVSTKNSGESG